MKLERRSLTPLAEINVTPLVDVMLVLLIIFMVAAPLLEQGIEVNLPKAGTSQRLAESNAVITLTKEHAVYFNDAAVTLKQMRQRLGTLKTDQPILIRSDRSARVDKLIELWDLCRSAGFLKIRIMTLSEGDSR